MSRQPIQRPWRRTMRTRLALAVWLALVAVGLPGCGGCGGAESPADKAAEAERKKQEEAERREREKPDFVIGELRTEPNGLESHRVEAPLLPVKPGHWTSATILALANRDDFSGQFDTGPFELNGMPYSLNTARGAVLAKGQAKQLEFLFFPPEGRTKLALETRLATSGDRSVLVRADPLHLMSSHQFFFLVLADEPARYAYLRTLDTVRAPGGLDWAPDHDMHYRVLLPEVKSRVPVPSTVLTWTSTAYLLWDGFDPGRMTLDQQRALVDWLHWGGQLLVSGPDSLDPLAQSFLGPYLPADAGTTVQWTADQLADLMLGDWAIAGPKFEGDRAWTGVELVPRRGAETTLTAGDQPLVVERRVGRGRVAVTAFNLNERELRTWKKVDTFLNSCLLRRPPRKYDTKESLASVGPDGTESVTIEPFVEWLDQHDRYDATRISRVSIYTRDAAPNLGTSVYHQYGLRDGVESEEQPNSGYQVAPLETGPGLAGWDNREENPVAAGARQAIIDAAGIEIPDAMFVVRVMALYLAVLVPINWALFRLLGRTEWAWIAVPVLAIAFTVLVVRWAQLDIGFARAETDIAVVEMYADYDRAHVTRYTALYTSLATTFAVEFDKPGAVAEPFPAGEGFGENRSSSMDELTLRQGETTRLEGFRVASNSIGLLHSEHMQDLDGAIRLTYDQDGDARLENGTRLTLQGAGVLGPAGAAWIGELAPGATAELDFQPFARSSVWSSHRAESAVTAPTDVTGALRLDELIDAAQTSTPEGETRLVAWTEDDPGGVTVSPQVSQRRHLTMVVAHLESAPLDTPQDDVGEPMPPKKRDESIEAAEPGETADESPTDERGAPPP